MTNGLEKLTYGTPEPKIKEAFRKVFYEGLRKTQEQEPTGLMGTPYETPEFKQKPLYEPTKEPKTTESREFQAGQIGEEALERNRQRDAVMQEYKNFFLTQTDLGQDKQWAEKIPTMHLNQLQDLHTKYQEYETQKHQQVITQLGEQLGLTADMVGQLQRVYPEEELAPKMQLAGMMMTLLKSKHTSATLLKQFNELMFPEAEEEPDMYEKMGGMEQYGKLTGEEGYYTPEEMPTDISEEFGGSETRSIIERVTTGLQVEGNTPQILLETIIEEYQLDEETAKRWINQIAQERFGQTIDWTILE